VANHEAVQLGDFLIPAGGQAQAGEQELHVAEGQVLVRAVGTAELGQGRAEQGQEIDGRAVPNLGLGVARTDAAAHHGFEHALELVRIVTPHRERVQPTGKLGTVEVEDLDRIPSALKVTSGAGE